MNEPWSKVGDKNNNIIRHTIVVFFIGGRPLPRSHWTSAWTPQLVPLEQRFCAACGSACAAGGTSGAQVGWPPRAWDDAMMLGGWMRADVELTRLLVGDERNMTG